MNYNIGDKVLIVNERTDNMNSEGLMDKWLGKIMTIRRVYNDVLGDSYFMTEDMDEFHGNCFSGWLWCDKDIQGKVIGNKVIK